MVRELMHDPIFLARKSVPATAEDLATAQDLLDTLTFHKEGCVGMAANMIGVTKRIIVFDNEGEYMTMLNPVILKGNDLTKLRKAACPCWAGPGSASDTRKSRFSTKIFKCRPGSEVSPVGQRKSSSMRSITATVC